MNEATSPQLQRAKSRISAESWERRVEQAKQAEVLIKQVLAEVAGGVTLNEAMARRLPASRRSWALRLIPGYREHGFEAFIDTRTPREPQAALATRRARLDVLVGAVQTIGATFARVAVEHQQALLRAEQAAAAASAAHAAVERNQARTAKLEQQLTEGAARQRHLQAQRSIRQIDVAQDEILTATKLTATQLIAFALRLYLTALPMTSENFVSRVFPMRGRKEIGPDLERVIFYENPRDPVVNAGLEDACRRLNDRKLMREGRRLRYAVEEAPTTGRSG